ncbi:SusF/SusE family outer membrane protein [Tamlana sp. I1]|uniref:SusF/SusE family outer membrane protein n=1 Tax=Tamlana sp. I1 TaxID=2762061 RepID=UPI00188E54B8|nr:SusF/SusE family outer membrane protein [Tamlana sp. I1]
MKNIKIIALFITSMLALSACTDDDGLTYIAQPKGDVEFTNSFLPEYLLSSTIADNVGERFTWESVDFETPTNISYQIQRSIIGDFTDAEVVGTTSENNYAVTIGDMISYAEEAGLDNDPDTEAPNTGVVTFRIRAFAGTDSDTEVISDGVPLTLVILESADTPTIPTFRNLFLVGDGTAPGWNPNNNNPAIIRDPADENIYSYTAYFNGGADVEGFKLVEVLGEWQPQWGGSAGTLGMNDGTGTDPSAFKIPVSGYYKFNMNITDMTYTLVEYDASAAPIYPTIGLIGDATEGAWDNDTDLTQSPFDPHVWFINDVVLTDGEIKFRADDAWDVSWGSDTALSGLATLGGPNIPAMAGTYDIWFNDLDGGYILIPVE